MLSASNALVCVSADEQSLQLNITLGRKPPVHTNSALRIFLVFHNYNYELINTIFTPIGIKRNFILTSIIVPIPAGIRTSREEPSSSKYKNITAWLKARQSTVCVLRPARLFLLLQKLMSFLKARKSNRS